MFNFVGNITIGNIKCIMKKLFLVLVILPFVENTMGQIKMAQFPEKEKKEVIFVYDSLTNINKNNASEYADYYKHMIGQKITSIASVDCWPSVEIYRKSKYLNNDIDKLKSIDGKTFYIDSIAYNFYAPNGEFAHIFYISEENNRQNQLGIVFPKECDRHINLAWVSNGYFEKIKSLYLEKELVYINKDDDVDIREYSSTRDRFMDYNTRKNLTKKIPCNSVWKCTDILVLPDKLKSYNMDCDNRVILNIENAKYGQYYIFAAELLKLKEWSKQASHLGHYENFLTMEEFHKYQAMQNQLTAAAKAKAAKAAAESEKRAKEHREYIIAKYGETYGSLILQGRVVIGMTKDQCIEALGHPTRINRTTTASRVSEQWVYSRRYLYFENGVLVTIQD